MTNKKITPPRLESLDCIRGLAIIMMGQYHFMRWFINEDSLNRFVYYSCYIPGRLAGPFFLLISGIGAVLIYEKSRSQGIGFRDVFIKTSKRGLFLIVLSLLLNILSSTIFNSGKILEWNIFHLIGTALIMSSFFSRIGPYWCTVVILLIQLLTKLTSDNEPSLLDFLITGLWCFLPYINYFLFGCVLGHVIIKILGSKFNHNLFVILTLITLFLTLYNWSNVETIRFTLVDRTLFVSMVKILLLFILCFLFLEIVLRLVQKPFEDIIKMGRIALSTYYAQILFKYVIVIYISLFTIHTKTVWGLEEWFALNIFFWSFYFLFVRLIWSKLNYTYSVEWFMNKYISPRGLMQNDK